MNFQTVSYKRHWDEQSRIAAYRERLQSIFVRLVNEGWVEGADVMAHKKVHKLHSYVFQYDILLRGIDHDVTFIFQVNYNKDVRKIEVESNSRRCLFIVPASCNEEVLYHFVYSQIIGWKKGEDSEKLFLNNFLLTLKSNLPERILSAYKTADREDKVRGVDFIVRYIVRPYYESIELPFNLKSSRIFLRKHDTRYPTISTFIFTPFDLEDPFALKQRFFRFILTAPNRVVHF